MAVVPWTEQEKEAFLRFQFSAQKTFYEEQFSGASFDLLILNDEVIGRLFVDVRADEIRLVDVALLPAFRGHGFGGRILSGILSDGQSSGRVVRIHVEQNNPAMRLYLRLGFKQIETQGVYHLMEWSPTKHKEK